MEDCWHNSQKGQSLSPTDEEMMVMWLTGDLKKEQIQNLSLLVMYLNNCSCHFLQGAFFNHYQLHGLLLPFGLQAWFMGMKDILFLWHMITHFRNYIENFLVQSFFPLLIQSHYIHLYVIKNCYDRECRMMPYFMNCSGKPLCSWKVVGTQKAFCTIW